MIRKVTQREPRNQGGLTRNGVPVGELAPIRRRQFVNISSAKVAFARAPKIDDARFREDVDVLLDQDPTPRA